MKRMSKLAVLMYAMSTPIHLTKDPCSYAYYLAKECGYETSYVYFSTAPLHDAEFEKYCRLEYLGDELDFRTEIKIGQAWLEKNAKDLDVLMLFNYGTSTYRTANYAKKINPNIKIWCKLDMSERGFSHFYDGTITRKIKSSIEYIKGRNIDLYTVENKQFYNILKNHIAFNNRLHYLPNCVSLLNVDVDKIDGYKQKEQIFLTVGRPGDANKNSELFLNAIDKLPDNILAEWKFYFVGPYTDQFYECYRNLCEKRAALKKAVVFTGAIYDRQKIYELYKKSRFFVLTSYSEGFNVSVIEAMYFGCYPILTYYGRSVLDITNSGQLGTILKGYSTEELTEVMEELIQSIGYDENKQIEKNCRYSYDYAIWSTKLMGYLANI